MKTDSYSLKRAAKLSVGMAISRLERAKVGTALIRNMRDFYERQAFCLFDDNTKRLETAKPLQAVRQGSRFIIQVFAA